MARTRNRQMKQAEAFVQASPKKIWKAGIYTRISVAVSYTHLTLPTNREV